MRGKLLYVAVCSGVLEMVDVDLTDRQARLMWPVLVLCRSWILATMKVADGIESSQINSVQFNSIQALSRLG